MQGPIDRRGFVRGAARLGVAGGLLLRAAGGAPAQEAALPVRRRPPPLDPALVQGFVRAGHADLAAVRQMLDEEPGLLNATWDWGGGDWETALGGAGHMGNHEIAEHLLSRGARLDVFCAAMLGRTEVVRSILRADPGLVRSLGPHGISLLRHAQAGGSAETEALLRDHGAS